MIKEIKSMKESCLAELLTYLFSIGMKVKLTIRGGSMYPFLRDGIDSVLLGPPDCGKIKKGNVVLYQKQGGQYVIHRIVFVKKKGLYIAGDAQQVLDGPVQRSQVLAAAESVYRKGVEIPCTDRRLRFSVCFWIALLPFRQDILDIYRYIRNRRKKK